jgi:hypothetical protein
MAGKMANILNLRKSVSFGVIYVAWGSLCSWCGTEFCGMKNEINVVAVFWVQFT